MLILECNKGQVQVSMEGIFSNSENYLNASILEAGDGIQSLIGLYIIRIISREQQDFRIIE